MSSKKLINLIVAGVLLIAISILSFRMFETVGAGEIVVIQYPSGKLGLFTTAGIKGQWFGTSTRYKKSFQYNFYTENKDEDQSIKVRFNDGGHAQLQGSCRISLPTDGSMLLLHQQYGSQEAIERDLVRRQLEKAVYMTGTLMSSKESSFTKRNDLLAYIADQAEKGVYKTRQREVRKVEDGSDTSKIVTVVELVTDANNNILRQEVSPFSTSKIGFGYLSIKSLDYDAAVEKQIKSQQELQMQVQTSMAEAKTAEQKVYTTQKQGEANAAEAKWKQETIKAQAVTQAEQELAVQQLREKTAASYKQQQILEGEGEAEKKRLIMNANGALDVKLEAWLKSQQYWADAFSKYTGNLVPQFQMGGPAGNNAIDWMQLMGMRAAKDLSLDLSNKK